MMSLKLVDELLKLKGWRKTDLAAALEVTEAAVMKWYRVGHAPAGPANVLLKLWLEEAREAKLVGAR